MQSLRNSVLLIGNVSGQIYFRTTPNGTKQANFSIAINESYKTATGEKITETHWHALVAVGKVVTVIEKITKGSKIAIEGKLCNRSYTNKDGIKVNKTEIQVRELMILELKESTDTKVETYGSHEQGNDREA